MTLDELEHIFRFQMTADADYTPKATVEYLLIQGRDRSIATQAVDQLANLTGLLTGFEFEGYQDRMPVFVMPDSQV